MTPSIGYELDTKPFLGQQPFRCPKCDTTRMTNLVAPACKECKTEMVLIQFQEDTIWDFNGQEIFLTWSQTPETLTPALLLEGVSLAFSKSSNGIQDYLITREPHQKGGQHLHAYFRFEKRFRTQDRKFFNWEVKTPLHIDGLDKFVWSPQWQRIRGNKHKLFHYIKKDGEYNFETKLGYIANFDSRPRVLQLVDDCESWEEYYDGIVHLGSDYWKVKASIELMRIKLERLHGYLCRYHKWVAGTDGGYYVCMTCKEIRHPDDLISKGLTEKGVPRSIKQIFGGK